MNRETIIPNDEQHWLALRAQDITSTESAALFGVSPYVTRFELWHEKRDAATLKLPPNERMEWGVALQDAIAAKFARDRAFDHRRMDEYMRLADARMGSSFDFEFGQTVGEGNPRYIKSLGEIKNVDFVAFRDGWAETEFGIEAPTHIEVQVQHQMHVSGIAQCYIVALVGGNRVVVLERSYDATVGANIEAAVRAFWRSIDEGIEPEPNFRRDADFIGKLYGYAEPNKVIDASGNDRLAYLANVYNTARDAAKSAEEDRESAKAEMLRIIGDAERIEGIPGFKLSAKMLAPVDVKAHTRAGRRNFRLTTIAEK